MGEWTSEKQCGRLWAPVLLRMASRGGKERLWKAHEAERLAGCSIVLRVLPCLLLAAGAGRCGPPHAFRLPVMLEP